MRVELKGKGTPIPELALPAPGVVSELPPQAFLLGDGASFEKADFVGLGYTNFEVWCIGAVGGRGGDNIFPQLYIMYGGGGGGGGFHRVVGLLADLPDSCPVIVGQAGADGQDSNLQWPMIPETHVFDGENVLNDPLVLDTNPDYVPPLAGQDGGASSFNGDTCRASGGKGGAPTKPDVQRVFTFSDVGAEWSEYATRQTSRRRSGDGGEGGSGGQIEAGGGGLGGSVTPVIVTSPGAPSDIYVKPKDGTWDGEIGQGGGGGIGGFGGLFPATPGGDPAHWSQLPTAALLAENGAKGSYSYRDTSVYGVGQLGSTDPSILTPIRRPGSGGGARLSKLAAYGSHAPGANPNGAVFIRLTKVV